MTPEPLPAWPRAALLTALAYAVAAVLSQLLTLPPHYASPLFPSAGIAVVTTLMFGPKVLVGVWLGSFASNVVIGLAGAPGSLGLTLALSASIGLGASLQAAAAAWLVRRFLIGPLTLTEPREVARFFAYGGALACLISATVGIASLVAAQVVAPTDAGRTWLVWWCGDTMGVLIAAPIALALVGRPTQVWLPRRRTVALPLAVVAIVAAGAIMQERRWDEARSRALFDRDAASAMSAVQQRLQTPLHALQAMHSLYAGSEDVDAAEFARASRPWTEGPEAVQAIGWAERVALEQVPAFEAEARSEGSDAFTVFDRGPQGERLPPTGPEVAAIRFIEPFAANQRALGVNALSIAEARHAIETAERSQRSTVSAGFKLTQETGRSTGAVLYRSVAPHGDGRRGLLFVTLRMDDFLAPVLAALPAYLELCLLDTRPERRRLAGPEGCESQALGDFEEALPVAFGQRDWELRVGAPRAALLDPRDQGNWLFALLALAATSLLGALLLTMSGRTRRIEAAVEERTAALSHEIAERGRTEVALRDSEQRLRTILNHVPIGVFYADLQGTIMQTNPRFRELVGYAADELNGMRAADFVHAEDRDADLDLTARLVRGEMPAYQRQQRYVRRDGQVLSVRSIVSLLRDTDGRAHRIVGVVEDITEHLALEQAQSARELAEAANRAKSEFVSRMSHELRTPLNAMLGFAQLIALDQRQELSASQRDWVGQIQTAGWHLLEMINDTLDLSRIESGTLRLESGTVDLAQTLAATLPLVEGMAAKRRITIEQALAPEGRLVRGDPTRVKQILTNLLSNAVKYNVDGGQLRISSRVHPGGAVELAVADTGIGMSDEQLAHLFRPFNRLGRERSGTEGTGIGLVISQRLAELMGGTLVAHSAEGQGSTFVLGLPGVPAPRELPPVKGEASDGGVEAATGDYRQRIVHYIEDNETNAVVMEGILAQRPQVKLQISATGLDALAAIRATPPSLILLDMHLPDIDGLQLLRMLKDDPATASIPVVVVSADAVASRIKAAVEAGAEHYLTKPVNVAELLRLVDELLEQRDTLFG